MFPEGISQKTPHNCTLQATRHGAECVYTALGWWYRSSPRRKRREVKRTDTRIPVPVPDPTLLIPFADPHDLDTSWCLPDCTVSTSVPVVGLVSVAFPELHPLNGVRRDLQLSSQRGWADTGGHPRTFFGRGKVRKKPSPGSSASSSEPAGE